MGDSSEVKESAPKMIIRIKKRNLIAVLILLIASLPVAYAAYTGFVRGNFKVELVISNRNPSINVSNVTAFSVDPISASAALVLISFNVTDSDGASNINASTAIINFTLGNPGFSQFYTNISAVASSEFGTCYNGTDGSTSVQINCTVVLPYFANASSSWVVNISVKDTNGGTGRNDTLRFTYNTLSALNLPNASINFSSVNLGQQDVPSNRLILNNTGNDDFDQINISVADLIGQSISSEFVGVGNFSVNISNENAGIGQRLSKITLPIKEYDPSGVNTAENASIIHGHTNAFAPNKDKGNRTLYFWVDVPSSGLSAQLYNNTWNVTVFNYP